MQLMKVEGDIENKVAEALTRSPLFSALGDDQRRQVAKSAVVEKCEPGETIVEEGGPSDSFHVILGGEVAVVVGGTEICRLQSPEGVGELGILLGTPRTATVNAVSGALLAKFSTEGFNVMFEKIPDFGRVISRALAERLARASRHMPLPSHPPDEKPDPEVVGLLPTEFIQRHRVLPLKQQGNVLTLGFVNDPNGSVIAGARQLLPGMEFKPVHIAASQFNEAMQSRAGLPAEQGAVGVIQGTLDPDPGGAPEIAKDRRSPQLDQLLTRMVAEGASDLHLSARQVPRWRIDGEMFLITDLPPLTSEQVYKLMEPTMPGRNVDELERTNDTDFAYEIPGVARFRVNMFRDNGGIGTVMRQIPAKVLTMEQLALPDVFKRFCDQPKGLVLVTGPTGSGKSTTLAAMIDYINKSRRTHIITMEDPIEFVHQSRNALINQREVGPHTDSFARALRAALREDPDIVLVGELRDLETMELALETANTGHLVFGTLHTATAVSTMDRVIDLFPSGQQNQIRSVLADSLKGVISQTLLRKRSGGRVAAFEILVVNFAVSNLIRDAKTFQVPSVMSTGKAVGNLMLNEGLAALVHSEKVDYLEALSKAVDKADLAKRCGQPDPTKTGVLA